MAINARGLYYWDTVSSVAQMQANDLVTLVLGLSLLAISLWLSRRGSLSGRLLLAGTLGFVLYTNVTMCFGAAHSALFLVYVALFSLYAFILCLMSFDLKTLFQDQVPLLENVTSMFIQVMDLGLIVPLCVLSGILLLRRNAWGYLLASVGMKKFLTMGIAVSLMGLNMARVGVPVSAVELGVFPIIALVNLVIVGLLLKNIKD